MKSFTEKLTVVVPRTIFMSSIVCTIIPLGNEVNRLICVGNVYTYSGFQFDCSSPLIESGPVEAYSKLLTTPQSLPPYHAIAVKPAGGGVFCNAIAATLVICNAVSVAVSSTLPVTFGNGLLGNS